MTRLEAACHSSLGWDRHLDGVCGSISHGFTIQRDKDPPVSGLGASMVCE